MPLQALDRLEREHRAEELDPRASQARFSAAHCSSSNAVRRKYSQRDSPSKYGGEGASLVVSASRVVELELDRVGAALGGHLREPDRVAEAAVVVHARLGDDVHPLHAGDRNRAVSRRRRGHGTLAR